MADNLSKAAQEDVAAVQIRAHQERGWYVDKSRKKIHVMWAVGHIDADDPDADDEDFVQHGPERRHYIEDATDENGDPVAGQQYYTQFRAQQCTKDTRSLIVHHLRGIGKL